MAAVREHTPWEVVARIAGRVIGKHEDNVRVGYAEAFHCSIPASWSLSIQDGDSKGVHSQCIRHMLSFKDFRCKIHLVDQRCVRGN